MSACGRTDAGDQPLIGALEGLDAYQASGWAFNPARPNEHVQVEIWLGPKKVGSCRADFRRSDLRALGMGDGAHGFLCRLELGARLTPEIARSLAVHVHGADGAFLELRHELSGGELTSWDWRRTDLNAHPVFILGSHRSGTSALTAALLATGRFQGQSEGELLDLLTPLMSAVDAFFDDKEEWFSSTNTMFRLVPRSYFLDAIRNIFVDLVTRLFPKGCWLDKTPGAAMIRIAPLLHEIWPNTRFVFLKRRGLENVVSRRQKFPGQSFEQACTDWAESMLAWPAVGGVLGRAAVEIDQLVLARSPERIAALLGEFLSLSQSEAEAFVNSLRTPAPERTWLEPPVLTSGDLDWDEPQWHTFRQLCDEAMARFGYSYDGEYRAGTGRWIDCAIL